MTFGSFVERDLSLFCDSLQIKQWENDFKMGSLWNKIKFPINILFGE